MRSILFTLVAILFPGKVIAAGECSQLDPPRGTLIQLTDSQDLKSIFSSFVVGLDFVDQDEINDALIDAEGKAKRALVAFMKEKLSSEYVQKEVINKRKNQSSDGSSNVVKDTLKTQIRTIQSNVEKVMVGVKVVDTCVDQEGKKAGVTVVFSPKLANLATSASVTMSSEAKRQSSADDSSRKKAVTAKEVGSSPDRSGVCDEGDRTEGQIKITSLTAVGNGSSEDQAVESALRSGVSQVFGERFASQSNVREVSKKYKLQTNVGIDLKAKATSKQVASSTSRATQGQIKSYRVVDMSTSNQRYTARVCMELAKYQSTLETGLKFVVLPTVLRDTPEGALLASEVKESLINQLVSSGATVLDRDNLRGQLQELKLVAAGNSPVTELSKLGNTLGADFIVVTEITDFNSEESRKVVGDVDVVRYIYDAQVNLKVIEVATSQLGLSEKVSIRNFKLKSPDLVLVGEKISAQAARKISRAMKLNLRTKAESHASKNESYQKAKTASSERMRALEEKNEKDW